MPAAAQAPASSQVRRRKLLGLLADGQFHSGQRLAQRLRISRAGVWKLVGALREAGIEIESVPRQGYRLPRAVDLLDKNELLGTLTPGARERLQRIDILLSVDSTNRFVYENGDAAPGQAQLCMAELQNAGRGRRGRSWVAPFGSGICMSVGWSFRESPPTFSALSLAIGVAVVNALQRFGAADVGLKWPNDLLWRKRKLGGILIEMRGESAGPSQVVIGLGLNMRMPSAVRVALAEQQAALIADVHEILQDRTPTRSVLAAAVLEEMIGMLPVFAHAGFVPWLERWRQLDALANAPVKVLNGAETTSGTARGVDADGTLLVDVDGELRRFVSGEVSLRAAQ